jgi:hypothetical protein
MGGPGRRGRPPGAQERRLNYVLRVLGLRRGAPCEITLALALQGGIPVDPNRPGGLWMYESRSTTLLNTSHPHHRQGSELPTGEHISASIESSTGLGTSRFIERPERGLFAHGPVSGRWWVWADVPHAHSTAGTPAAAAASLETFHVGGARGTRYIDKRHGLERTCSVVYGHIDSSAVAKDRDGTFWCARSCSIGLLCT